MDSRALNLKPVLYGRSQPKSTQRARFFRKNSVPSPVTGGKTGAGLLQRIKVP
jgi:hypothetical protein